MNGLVDTKILQDLESLGFILCLAKPEVGKVSQRKVYWYDNRAKRVRVTLRGGGEASERKRGIGENERLPEMTVLAAR